MSDCAAVAFTGGATACFFLAGTPAQASADAGAESDSSDADGRGVGTAVLAEPDHVS
ncbi:hypothetical protein [Mycolicibacterium iranicum]|uniref:hypothetical protein n=1 Tax=Mycolicibacterium iranicum TaxID=912594 RepID=UPI0013A59E46|nr:hypothetical protein [Mycolicibacterium iranicum]